VPSYPTLKAAVLAEKVSISTPLASRFTLSALVGTAFPLQLAASSQLLVPAPPSHVIVAACATGTKQLEASNATKTVLNGKEDMEITQADKHKGTERGANPTPHDDIEYYR
jgi:hypothetical protein